MIAPETTLDRFCIVGAGSSGLAAARRFAEAGIAFDCLEQEADLGGNWRIENRFSSVYASTHMISSKRLTEYPDFPMPDDYPHYPGHRLVWEYLDGFARQYDLRRHIAFGTVVERLEPLGTGWEVRLGTGERRRYRGVVIANGHNWDPRIPEFPGSFLGEALHSSAYKTPDVLRGRRVLVVGGGNSGCDLACEAAIHAARAFHSTRRAYHVLPKFFRGKPIDACNELLLVCRAPLWFRRAAAWVVTRLVLGPSARTGVPAPDHRLFEAHPIINSQLHHHVGHGRLVLKPNVARLDGRRVEFVDGSFEEIDLILWATGFQISFPFIDRELLAWRDGAPDLYLHVFHRDRDDLFCLGLIQPDSGQFGLVDRQAELVARYIRARERQTPGGERFARERRAASPPLSGGVRYLDSPRHRLEVEHFGYRRLLERHIARLAG